MSDLFPLKAYRGHQAIDTGVLAKMPSAKAQVIDTQFDAATADTLASAVLAATKNPGLSYTFTVDGVISPSDMVGAIKLVKLNYGTTITNYVAKITDIKVNWGAGERGQTTLTVRGVS